MRLPRITNDEWKLIAPILPPSGGRGKPRHRRYCSAFFYAEACRCSLESLPGYANSQTLRTRRQRWEADGTLAKVMEAGASVIRRMRREYWANFAPSPRWVARTGNDRASFSVAA
jgi:transposase